MATVAAAVAAGAKPEASLSSSSFVYSPPTTELATAQELSAYCQASATPGNRSESSVYLSDAAKSPGRPLTVRCSAWANRDGWKTAVRYTVMLALYSGEDATTLLPSP